MKNKKLNKKVAYLEFVNDQLMAEIKDVDNLLRQVGFPGGLETIKLAAKDILSNPQDNM